MPGLRVDELAVSGEGSGVNESRQADAERRIWVAKLQIEEMCEPVTVSAIARLAKAHKQTVTRVLRTPVHTPKEDLLYKGMNRLPHVADTTPPPTLIHARVAAPGRPAEDPNLCRGGCGKPMPPGQMCLVCATREAEECAPQGRNDEVLRSLKRSARS